MVYTRSTAKELHQSLKTYRIAISGYFGDIGHDHVSLASIIRQFGGKPDAIITKATTHLVCKEDHLNNRNRKVKTAMKNNTPIMMPSWLTDLSSDTTCWAVDDYEWSYSKIVRSEIDTAKGLSSNLYYNIGQRIEKEIRKPVSPPVRGIQDQLEINLGLKTPSKDLMQQNPSLNHFPSLPTSRNNARSKSFNNLIGGKLITEFCCLKVLIPVALACSLLVITGTWLYLTR